MIHLVVSDSVLTWFIRYNFYRNVQFLNHEIFIKTTGLPPQALMILTNFGYPVLPLGVHVLKNFQIICSSFILTLDYRSEQNM